MSRRYLGGYITTSFDPLNFGAVTVDPNFEYVTLLLHGDGTNGTQNNTFIDGSTNNFTITRNGNTTQGTFSPYGDLWSNYFDGTGDYLTVPSSVALEPGSNNFTVEVWIYPQAYPSSGNGIGIIRRTNASGYDNFSVTLRTNGAIEAYCSLSSSASLPNIITAGNCPLYKWSHVAFVKNGLIYTLYIDGSQVGTVTNASHPPTGLSTITDIGIQSQAFSGYISNLRVVKGTALYTTNFTPSTTLLTAITNTSLLTCQSNRFIDNSSNAFAITRNGDVKVTKFSPFNPSAAYATGVTGGSAYFDGSGDSVSAPSNTIWTWANKSAWTFEAWIYPITIASVQPIYASFVGNTNNGELYLNTSGNLVFRYWIGSQVLVTSSGTVNAQSWNHVAFVYDGTNISLYINGSRQANVARQSPADTSTNAIYVGTTSLGHSGFTQLYFTGYITDARVVNGSAVYTGTSFTPTTVPLTAITNTSLLLNFTNAGIIDNSRMNDLETVGNAQISTTQKKFGTGALYFDGNGDYTTMRYDEAVNFGTGNFTIEMWIYPTSTNHQSASLFTQEHISANNSPVSISIFLSGATIDTTGNSIGFGVYNGPAGSTWIVNKPNLSAITINVWTHIALVRSGTTFTMFVNGSSVGTATNSTSCSLGTTNYLIGRRWDTAGSYPYYNGYIDDLRITKGIARYTANFTPPTVPFEDL